MWMLPFVFAAEPSVVEHLTEVHADLAAADVSHLTPAQRAHRSDLLEVLAQYRSAQEFPSNPQGLTRIHPVDVPGTYPDLPGHTPIFVSDDGAHCAVGYLLAADGRDELVERIRVEGNTRFIHEIDDAELLDWARDAGLSVAELARIQPSYPPGWSHSAEGCFGEDSGCNWNADTGWGDPHTGFRSHSEFDSNPDSAHTGDTSPGDSSTTGATGATGATGVLDTDDTDDTDDSEVDTDLPDTDGPVDTALPHTDEQHTDEVDTDLGDSDTDDTDLVQGTDEPHTDTDGDTDVLEETGPDTDSEDSDPAETDDSPDDTDSVDTDPAETDDSPDDTDPAETDDSPDDTDPAETDDSPDDTDPVEESDTPQDTDPVVDTDDDEDPKTGCQCDSGAPTGMIWLSWLPLVLLRRRSQA